MNPGLEASSADVMSSFVRHRLHDILESVRKVPRSIFSPLVFLGAIRKVVSILHPIEVAMTCVTASNVPIFAAQYPTLLRASTGLEVESCELQLRDMCKEDVYKLAMGDSRMCGLVCVNYLAVEIRKTGLRKYSN